MAEEGKGDGHWVYVSGYNGNGVPIWVSDDDEHDIAGFDTETHEFDADHPPVTADGFDAPPVPGGEGGGDGTATEVSTPSIDLFRTNMLALHDPLQQARDELGSINIRAGAFNQAVVLRDKVGNLDAPESVVAQFDLVITRLIETLAGVEKGAADTVSEYETTEEQNQVTVQELQGLMPDLGLLAGDPAVGGTPTGGGDLAQVDGAASTFTA